MKKSLIIILAALLCVCIFAGCGERGEENGTDVIVDGTSGEIGGEVSGEPQSAATDEAERGETTERGVETDEPSTQEKLMPNVINCTEEDARVMLETLGVVVNVEYEYNDDVADGNVIRASVEFGDVLSDGDEIIIYVSKGKHTEEEIVRELLDNFTVLYWDIDDVPLISSDVLKYYDTEMKTYYLSDSGDWEFYYYLFEHDGVKYEVISERGKNRMDEMLTYLFGTEEADFTDSHWLPTEILGYNIRSVDISVCMDGLYYFSCNAVENNEKNSIVIYTQHGFGKLPLSFDAVSKDVDGDGIEEFITPTCFADGGSFLTVHRLNDGVIETGRMKYDPIELFEPYLKEEYGEDLENAFISERQFVETYNAEKNVFCVTYIGDESYPTVEFSGLDCIEF